MLIPYSCRLVETHNTVLWIGKMERNLCQTNVNGHNIICQPSAIDCAHNFPPESMIE